MPLRSRKVCDLKKMCRDAGLPVTGNKNQLIERLMDNNVSESESDTQSVVMQRLSSLEKTISDLVLQQKQNTTTSNNFVPPISSSPVNVIGNMEKSAPTVTSTYTVMHPQVLPNAYNSQHSLWTTAQEPSNVNFPEFSQSGHVAFVPQSNAYVSHACMQAPPTFAPPTFVPPVTSAPYATYQNPSVPYTFDYVRAPPVVPNYHNPYENVRDIVELLPVFDPSSDRSLTSKQFVKRVENLRSVYGWRENTLLFAVQQKMRGSAKYWVDSLQDVFISWAEFVHKFLLNFPCIENEADVHLKMAQTKRQNNESAQEFYYRMLALGSKGGLSDSSIARHIINGINDSDLRKKISNNYTHCQDLLSDIINFNIYNEVKTAPPKMVFKTNASIEKPPNRKFAVTENQKPQTPLPLEKVKCYNCFKFGHYSVNCAVPQRKPRCEKCQRTTHKTADCYVKAENRINIIDQRACDDKIVKTIKVNGIETLAFVDPGSSRTLIRKTFARKIGDVREQLTILKGFAGGQYASTEIVSAIIEIDGNNNPTIMPVIDDDFLCEAVLLGRDVLCRAGNRLVIEQDQCRIEDINKIDVTNDLSVIDRQSLQQLLTQHADAFARNLSEIGKCDVAKMSIELNVNIPICLKPYRIPFAKRAIVSEIVSELLSNNIIRPSESPYAAPVVLVEKKNGEHRLCVDYRSLNKVTIKRPYPMPIMEEQFAQLAGNNFFTTLDLRTGYHQIEIDESSKKYTAFVTTDGHYEYNRMPFGLVNAPAVFQCMMDKIIAQMPRGEVLAYLDDVIIPSKTIDEGLKRLVKFLKILKRYGLTLRMDKCKFLKNEIEHLGHVINRNGITPGKRKVAAIADFPPPKNVTEVRRFLGLTGFFRKFVPNYSIIVKPITQLLRKEEQQKFVWGEAQQRSFTELIQKLCNEPLLALYDSSAQHEVHTDASSVGLAGVMLQSSDGKKWQPVFYYSRHCTDAESRYHSYALEALAAVETLDRFRIYLLGKPFRLVTDCSALAKIKENKELKPNIARWWLRLLEFDFECIHRQGSSLSHVDALSRMPVEKPKEIEPAGFVLTVTADQRDWLLTMQLQDTALREIIQILNGELKSEREKQLSTEYQLKNQRLHKKLPSALAFVVPKAVRWRVVKSCHDDVGHPALEKTIERIKAFYWFANLRRYVKSYISACIPCCYQKNRPGKIEGSMHFSQIDPIPFRVIHIDHMGPFIRSKRGNSYVLAVSDAFSKFLIVKAVRDTKTAPVINTLNEISSYFGLPNQIVSDRGTAFTSKAFENYCDENGIHHTKTAVRTPRANGQVERANQIILNFLRTTTENPKDWDVKIKDLQWTINSQKNSTTGFCPNELVFDFKLRDTIQNRLLAAIQDDLSDSNNTLPIEERREQAVTNINDERAKWKLRFDKRHAKPSTYNDNDLVVIENEPSAVGESRKLEPRYRGPYIISKVLGNDRYLIEDIPGMQITKKKFCSVYTSDKIKPWCSSAPELDDDDSDHEIEGDSPAGVAELSPDVATLP